MPTHTDGPAVSRKRFIVSLASVIGLTTAGLTFGYLRYRDGKYEEMESAPVPFGPRNAAQRHYFPRTPVDTAGYGVVTANLHRWPDDASLQQIADSFQGVAARIRADLEKSRANPDATDAMRVQMLLTEASVFNFDGDVADAAARIAEARALVEKDSLLAQRFLHSLIFFQGVTALRQGENENCVLCIGQGACILPIIPTAVHKKTDGSKHAIKHFTDYLKQFPDDVEVKWLLNLAHMTLGEHPGGVDPKYLISLDHFTQADPQTDIGRFHDVAPKVGVNRLNAAGGAIMEDFTNDGFLDIVLSSFNPAEPMAYFRNKGDGTFEDCTEAAGLKNQLGGLQCVQTDYNNDGYMDIFVTRGAWLKIPMRPSLLRNNGDGTFTDVTKEAGLIAAVTSNAAIWADYDNDGFLDLFICCEAQPNKLYHNNGDGTFTEIAEKAGVTGYGGFYKGATWIDYDNDGYPDLFVNNLSGGAELYRNNRNGAFTDVTTEMGIDGPEGGFSCWAFDYDNDGYLDIFATCYQKSVEGVIDGLLGNPTTMNYSRLFRNKQGKGFEDVTKAVGLDMVFATMGSNFGDFNNDGYLDFYLGTGDPDLTTLVPNRMFRNIGGKRFAEVTASAGVGNLQKGHGVACGDWDNDGSVDIFIDMGGAVPGDKFRNSLYQNPGQGNHWLTIKLIGKKTNRAAIGARIKVVTDGPTPQTVHRHVSSGSSFGANPLQQTIGLGQATKVKTLEIHWPTSKTTQIFTDIAANQFLEITEFEKDYKKVQRKRVVAPA